MSNFYQKYIDVTVPISKFQYDLLGKIFDAYNDFYYDYLFLISLQSINGRPITDPNQYFNDHIKTDIKRANCKHPIYYVTRRNMVNILRSATQLVHLNLDRIHELYLDKCLSVDKLRTESYKWIKSRKMYNPKYPTLIVRDVSARMIRETQSFKLPKMGRIKCCDKYISMIPESAETVQLYIRRRLDSQKLSITISCNIPQEYDSDGFIKLIYKEN